MIDLNEKDLALVCSILRQHLPGVEVLAFGSRVRGRASKFSDLDLALRDNGPIDWKKMEKLRDAFAESDLPISVDLLDWHSITPEFRKLIEENNIVLRLD